jgi:hypothetical protein
MQDEVEEQTLPIICGPIAVRHQHQLSQLTPFPSGNTAQERIQLRGLYYDSGEEGITTNSIKKQLYSRRYHPENFKKGLPLPDQIKNSKKIDHRLKKIDGKLNKCAKNQKCHACIIFEVNHRQNEIRIQKLSVHLNSSTKTASAHHTSMQAVNTLLDQIAMCCQEQEVNPADFYKTMMLYGIIKTVDQGSKNCCCHCFHPSSTHHRHNHNDTKSNLYKKTADRHIPKSHPAKLTHPHFYEKFKDQPGEYIHPDIYRVIALRFSEKYDYGSEMFHRERMLTKLLDVEQAIEADVSEAAPVEELASDDNYETASEGSELFDDIIDD